ncbi:MAG TPA: hypothetical protein VJG32_04430 [Anaerolineae bacterium]|nr:hypothetical protein [Anaerolineae bacterium]
MSEERTKILHMVADGKITAEEASRLLAALGDDAEVEQTPAPPIGLPQFGNLWLIPMYIGLVLFVCGALAAFPLYTSGGSWLLAVCGWPLFLIGLLTMIAAYASRHSRWVHVRVTNVSREKRNVKFSFPLPLGLSAWGLRVAARFAPKLKETNVDEMMVAFNDSLAGEQPLYVDVQAGDDGERVQVYIG